MHLELKDKVAIVTGGIQGIGRATALRLAKEGAKVVIAARGKERLDAVAVSRSGRYRFGWLRPFSSRSKKFA